MADMPKLRDRTTIQHVAALLALALTPSAKDANQLRGPCPACNNGGKNALAINTEKQKYYCWTSNEHGDLLDLYRHVRKKETIKDAAIELEKLLDNPVDMGIPQRETKSPAALQKVIEYLDPKSEKIEHLGISPETCAVFQAGYAPKGTMTGRFVIALHTPAGDLIGFVGVALDDREPRFKYPDNIQRANLVFNAHRVRASDTVMVASDPLAVVLAFENGDPDAIAFL